MSKDSEAGDGLSTAKLELLSLLMKKAQLSAEPQEIISRLDRPSPRELSFAQSRLWFLNQLEPLSPFYNIPVALHLKGRLDVASLRQCLDEIMRRHETLRTRFVLLEGRPVQMVEPEGQARLKFIDLMDLPAASRLVEAKRFTEEETHRPFDLTEGSLLRAALLRLDQAEHVLLLVMHHIISDGWSLGILTREMAALYRLFSGEESSTLAELPIQYADFAEWQRRRFESGEMKGQLSYWKRQLAGLPPLLEMPADKPRPSIQTFRGAHRRFELSRPLRAALINLSRETDATLFMTLLAAFQTLLYRYTGQEDIAIGTPIANRNRSEVEGLVGFFVNTLVLRATLNSKLSFRQLLHHVREVTLEAYENQDLPFEKLVEELHPERDMSRSPLFQVMLTLQNTPAPATEFPGLSLSPWPVESSTSKYDLVLSFSEAEQKITGALAFNTDIFDHQTIDRLIAHLQTLLESIAAAPGERLSSLPFMSKAESRRILVEWNETATAYPPDDCLQHLFEAQVERTPEDVALRFEDEQLTYRELNCRANQLAHHIRRLGVGPETAVGIYMERSPLMVAALLGVLKAGGAYLPLDPAYPAQRLSHMLRETRAPLLLSQAHLTPSLPVLDGQKLIHLDEQWKEMALEDDHNPVGGVTSGNLAYIMYTSGSTGGPRGVMITHRAICNHMRWMLSAFPLTRADRVLQKTSFSFDASVWEFYAPLLSGARLVMARPGGQLDSAYLLKTIAREEITILQLVPTMLRLLLEEPTNDDCPSLKRLFCGGEVLSSQLAARFSDRFNAELHNLYGPTEAAIDVTVYHYAEGDKHHQSVPIGRPISNLQIYILDQQLNPLPVGIPGELHVGGVGLARGYFDRAGLTAERFIPNPFSAVAGARLYRTGDRACFLPDGNIRFLGRVDGQVKVRGFRIELGEIETTLKSHPSVREAIVVLQEQGEQAERLAAYVVTEQGRAFSGGELRQHLKAQLPEHMLPSVFMQLAAMPLLPNGKVDRRALPLAQNARLSGGPESSYVAPRNKVERVIAEVWQRVLHLEKVGVNHNFFDLGGHSLLMLEVHRQLLERFDKEIALTEMFRSPTVSHLASYFKEAEGEPQPMAQPSKAVLTRKDARRQQKDLRLKRHAAFRQDGLSDE
ncbi:MAG: hypothetical protein QOD00_2429 [Blastocatellia bacterium]|jgi:amino acid adenylation domain-containing protein|nr:hypothetical protein [Blastocatellia bacterium]